MSSREASRGREPSPDSGLRGHRIAEYQLEDEIGRGGMAVVYRARDLRLGRTVAVKVLAPELARNDNFRKRFAHESRVAAAIDHPHIVPIFEAGERDGVLYIAMRYVEGSDLRALLDREGTLTLEATCRVALQVASALDAAHAHDLVHRDVKPGNILLAEGTDSDRPEHAYLTDFGLTKKSLSLTGFTSVGQFVGTLDYVAPEQISGRPVDGRCDVYSLACVVFEMLTGAPPFRRDDDMALLWAHQYDSPPALSEVRRGLPQAVDAVLGKALAKAPDNRYETCRGFVTALRTAGRSGRPGTAGSAPAEHAATRVSAGPGTGADGPRRRTAAPPPPPGWAAPVFPARLG
ncbi:serine/threonine-protein kinase [Streptomyces sp. SPB162]|uniref:serine/threonine-protein kinase n=1 Tax=Streptomyces sp. SPB162 TaxID=2940560 RepID=UPI002406B454|nr:serine/threonine-protein kinase [Streptomyces sp. SPB162]MDF9815380.1 serine/threonine protein kinase [Streptomyces sp. SPB162]